MEQKTIVGLGEILWDLLPEGRLLGGAPANFAFHAAQLGERGVAVSRVGIDPLGDEIVARLQSLNLDPAHIQRDPYRPTGTVKVEIETGGQPRYTIVEDVAWDAIEWTPSLQALAERTEAVCFGSLAQRDSRSRATIIRFLESCPGDALRVFDINLRGHFFDAPTIGRGLELASIAKMNDEELPRISSLLNIPFEQEESAARELVNRFNLELACVTRGAKGSLLVSPNAVSTHPGIEVEVADTIGSGDAFVAAVVHLYLRRAPLDQINRAANRLGAFVATQPGATPQIPLDVLREVRSPS